MHRWSGSDGLHFKLKWQIWYFVICAYLSKCQRHRGCAIWQSFLRVLCLACRRQQKRAELEKTRRELFWISHRGKSRRKHLHSLFLLNTDRDHRKRHYKCVLIMQDVGMPGHNLISLSMGSIIKQWPWQRDLCKSGNGGKKSVLNLICTS